MSNIVKFVMISAVAMSAVIVQLPKIENGIRLLRASSPDLSTSVQDIKESC